MSGPLADLLELSARAALFPPSSRYHGIETATIERDGRTIVYLRRRFVPAAERFALLHEHVVSEGERYDTLAARYLGDPEQFWRLCDANAVMRPADLTATVGAVVRITLPEGIPGAQRG
jgi:hypothetical protein